MTLGAIPEARAPREDELEREEKFAIGRVILVAIDHGPSSQTAFSWALENFVTHFDSVHLLHVLPKSSDGISSCINPTAGDSDFSPMLLATQVLFDKLAKEAREKENVKVVSILRDGDAGKEICAEATKSKPVAVIMGSRGLGVMKREGYLLPHRYCDHWRGQIIQVVMHGLHQLNVNVPQGERK